MFIVTSQPRMSLTCNDDGDCADDEQHVRALAAESVPQNHGYGGGDDCVYKPSTIGQEEY